MEIEVLAAKLEMIEKRVEKLEDRDARLTALEVANAEIKAKFGIVAAIIATVSAAVVSFIFKLIPG